MAFEETATNARDDNAATTPTPGMARQQKSDCITIIANSPGQVIAEFHRQNLCEKGYSITNRILPHSFAKVNDNGRTDTLFDGETLFAATFHRTTSLNG